MRINKPGHGTRSRYVSGCRCSSCTIANAFTAAEYKRMRVQWLAEEPDIVQHGKVNTYSNYGCRCDPCRLAKKQSRDRRLDIPAT